MVKRLLTWFGIRPTKADQRGAEIRAQYVKDLMGILGSIQDELSRVRSQVETRLQLQSNLLDALVRKMDNLDLVRDAMNRVSELALVAAGRPTEATQFRQVAGAVERGGSSWVDQQEAVDPDQWPPPGTVEVISRG